MSADQPTPPRPAVPEPTPHGPPVPPPTERDLRRDATIEYELITAAMPWKSWTDKATSDLILGWIRLAAHYRAALAAERNNRLAADEAMVTLHEALQKAETELDAERRRAEAAEEQRDAMIGMDEAGVDTLLERWDQTAPHVQRGIVAKFTAMFHENAEEAKGWRKAIEEMSDAGATACQAAAKLTEERAALRQEVAGLQKSADQLRADLRTAAERVAAQSELLSRRADRPT